MSASAGRDRRWAAFGLFGLYCIMAVAAQGAVRSEFRFDRDTFSFANDPVIQSRGNPHATPAPAPAPFYTRRCFVMTRAALQFYKFAAFDPAAAPLNDAALTRRIRAIMRRGAWREPLQPGERIVIPGYANLRALSAARPRIVQRILGSGLSTYFRPANVRMVRELRRSYQERTHARLERSLARGEVFVAHVSNFPRLNMNHAILVYGRKPASKKETIARYVVYDPNHPEAPRELTWSPAARAFAYQKDWDFAGGFVRLYQCYSDPLQ